VRRKRGGIHKRKFSPFLAGAIGIVAIVAFSYGAYTKFANPFASPYTIHAMFQSANGLKQDSQVRIAGINVGKVESVAPVKGCKLAAATPGGQCTAADVTLALSGNGLPIHKDATFWIRPRIFLEGNFFVDLHPGSPSAPVAPDGFTFAVQQGKQPVQFDQLLTSLQQDTRANLQTLLQQFGVGVKRGGPTYNQSIQYWTPAYKYGSEVNHATLGTQPHDLSNFIDKGGQVNGAFAAHPQNLENLITDFNTTANAFARENVALSSAINELPRTLAVANPALNAVNNAFPPVREFARDLVPGANSTAPMIDASLPFFNQLRLLVQPSELGGLTNDLSSTVPSLAKLDQQTIPFMNNQVRPASSCQVNVILPWTKLTINDPNFNSSNGFPPHPVYVEGVDFLPGLAGESRNIDANGPFVRVLGNGGSLTYSLQPGMFGQSLTKIAGTQPVMPAEHTSGDGAQVPVSRPPLKPNVPCETQPAITEAGIQSPVGVGPKQINTSISPGVAGILQSAIKTQLLPQLTAIGKSQGLKVRLDGKATKGH
jgi:phospholipid/cholesterol/gamma-HCH transport system substrate-binding protein